MQSPYIKGGRHVRTASYRDLIWCITSYRGGNMLRIIAATLIAYSSSLQQIEHDLTLPNRCDQYIYDHIYENVSTLVLQDFISVEDRYILVMALRHKLCGKTMLAKYERGIKDE